MKKLFSVLLVLLLTVTAISISAERASRELKSNVLRLHIVANSDSDEDQKQKLAVRDAILPLIKGITKEAKSASEAEKKLSEYSGTIRALSQAELMKNGCNSSVEVSVEERYFSTKATEDYSLPAGEYSALTVTIGDGKGQNFWCLIYPEAAEGAVEEADEDTELLHENEGCYTIKFRIVELWGKLKHWIFG